MKSRIIDADPLMFRDEHWHRLTLSEEDFGEIEHVVHFLLSGKHPCDPSCERLIREVCVVVLDRIKNRTDRQKEFHELGVVYKTKNGFISMNPTQPYFGPTYYVGENVPIISTGEV